MGRYGRDWCCFTLLLLIVTFDWLQSVVVVLLHSLNHMY
jgi:hypothetical protein